MEYSSGTKKFQKTILALLAAAITLVLLLMLAKGLKIYQSESKGQNKLLKTGGVAQGTTWQITVWNSKGVDLGTLQKSIENEFKRLDELLSNYRLDSQIEKFNAASIFGTIWVGPEIVTMVQTAENISEATGGRYDITIKPLLDLWDFANDRSTPPDPSSLKDALERVGFYRLRIIPPDRLSKEKTELAIDLGSIAQGYSVGRVAAIIENAGISNYIVEIGGELQTSGHKPGGSPWRIGVERPLPGGRSIQKTLAIKRDRPIAVMTSGTYRKYLDQGGKRYSHILDARTGKPVEHNTVSVTVINEDPAAADAWSTALLCLGKMQGMAVANRYGVAALFITETEERLEEFTSEAWRSMRDIDVN